MKKYFLMVTGLTSFYISVCQPNCPVVKGYAFQRSTFPGTIQKGVTNENGTQTERPVKPIITNFIYAEMKPAQTVKPTAIWIRGKGYTVEIEKTTGPVIVPKQGLGGTPIPDTLVKETKNSLYRIQPKNLLSEKPPSKISKKMNQKNVIIEYYWKGKKQYYTIKDIKNLPPLALQ